MSQTPNTPARPVLSGETERIVSLREFEQRLFALQQQINERIGTERDLTDARSAALALALRVAAKEYKRRLAELNHAHDTAEKNWQQSLPRELFDSVMVDWRKWRDGVDASLVLLSSTPTHLGAVDTRLVKAEAALLQAQGALIFVRFLGLAGVAGLLLGLARMAGWAP